MPDFGAAIQVAGLNPHIGQASLFIASENSETANRQSGHSQLSNTGMADSLKPTPCRHSDMDLGFPIPVIRQIHYRPISDIHLTFQNCSKLTADTQF